MPDILTLSLTFVSGIFLGTFFFGGLWWTVQKGLGSKNPALWFLGSMLLRISLILMAFAFIAQGHWSGLLACVVGFLIARFLVVKRLSRLPADEQTPRETEALVAHQPR